MNKERWSIFFYKIRNGKSPIEDFLDNLPSKDLAQTRKEISLLRDFGPFKLGMPHVKYLDDKIWELRIRGKNHHRIIWFILKRHNIVFLHAFTKKENRISRRHLDTAFQRMQDFLKRFGGD